MGPALRRRIESDLRCHVLYRYADGDGKRQPEYAATHIRISAFHSSMSPALVEPLSDALVVMPGCSTVERITGHPVLRPQVVALFDRSVVGEVVSRRVIVTYSLPVYALVDLESQSVVRACYARTDELTEPLRVEWSDDDDPFVGGQDVDDETYRLAVTVATENEWPHWGSL